MTDIFYSTLAPYRDSFFAAILYDFLANKSVQQAPLWLHTPQGWDTSLPMWPPFDWAQGSPSAAFILAANNSAFYTLTINASIQKR